MEEYSRSRRTFFAAVGGLAAALLWKYLTPPIPVGRTVLISVPAADIPPEGALVFRLERVALLRHGNGYRAISLVCTHLGCNVTVTPEGFSCPCHGSFFNGEGMVLRGPADRPLPRLVVKEQGGVVEVYG